MADKVDSATRSRIMGRVASKNTSSELAVRRAVHAFGFRFRLHRKDLPGNPDVVFPRYKMAVFVHGCFWHGHGCKRARMPVTHSDYWTSKRQRNNERDSKSQASLQALSWGVVVIWTCQLQEGITGLINNLRAQRAQSI